MAVQLTLFTWLDDPLYSMAVWLYVTFRTWSSACIVWHQWAGGKQLTNLHLAICSPTPVTCNAHKQAVVKPEMRKICLICTIKKKCKFHVHVMFWFGFWGGGGVTFAQPWELTLNALLSWAGLTGWKLSIGVSACLLAKLNLYQQLELKLDQPVPFELWSNRRGW